MDIKNDSIIAQKKLELEHVTASIEELKLEMKHALLTLHFKEYCDCLNVMKRLKITRDKRRIELEQAMRG